MSEDRDSGLLDLLWVPTHRPTGGISQLVVIVLSGTGLLAGALIRAVRDPGGVPVWLWAAMPVLAVLVLGGGCLLGRAAWAPFAARRAQQDAVVAHLDRHR